MNEQLVEALPELDERAARICPYVGSLTTEQVAAYDSMVEGNRQAEMEAHSQQDNVTELYDVRMDEMQTTQTATNTQNERQVRKKKAKKTSTSSSLMDSIKVREGDQIDAATETLEIDEPLASQIELAVQVDTKNTPQAHVEIPEAPRERSAQVATVTEKLGPAKTVIDIIAPQKPRAQTKATEFREAREPVLRAAEPALPIVHDKARDLQVELSVSELDSRLETMIAEQLSLQPNQDVPAETQPTTVGTEPLSVPLTIETFDNNTAAAPATELTPSASTETTTHGAIENVTAQHAETNELFSHEEELEALTITIEAPQSTEDFIDSLAQVYAQPAKEFFEPTATSETDNTAATQESEPAPHLSRKITIETPPAVVAINTELVAKLEALEPEFEPEIALAVQASLTEIVDTIDEIGMLFEAAATEEQIPDLNVIQEKETALIVQCRQLLERLGIEADDESLRSFVRHLTLVHSAEKLENTEVAGMVSEEGTHESKYYGHYAWQRLKRFLRKPVDALAIRLGHYTLALHETV